MLLSSAGAPPLCQYLVVCAGELAASIEEQQSSEANIEKGTRDAAKHMQMDACYGLRTILCLWIVRSHMQVGSGASGLRKRWRRVAVKLG